jgi:hypothetical protein
MEELYTHPCMGITDNIFWWEEAHGIYHPGIVGCEKT